MYRKYYRAEINAEEKENGVETLFCHTSPDFSSPQSLKEWMKENKWEIGELKCFTEHGWDYDKNTETHSVKSLPISKITYHMTEEHNMKITKEIDIDNPPSTLFYKDDGVIGVELHCGDKVYRTLCNGDSYCERIFDYLKRKGIELPEGEKTISVFEPKDKDIILW